MFIAVKFRKQNYTMTKKLLEFLAVFQDISGNMRASLRENLSSGFATRVESNRLAQPKKLGRGLKFWISKKLRMGPLISAFVVHIWHKQVFS